MQAIGEAIYSSFAAYRIMCKYPALVLNFKNILSQHEKIERSIYCRIAVGMESLFYLADPKFRYGLPPCRSHSLLNSNSKISAPRLRVRPVSSRLNSHICMSSTPAMEIKKKCCSLLSFIGLSLSRFSHGYSPAISRMGGLSACNSICLATYCPSKCAYHIPRLSVKE